MIVYVKNKHGENLMPCSPRKARKLLKGKKAKVIKLHPFSIQLLYGSTGYKQDVVVGIDKGSHETGISCVGNGKVLLSAQINHRTNIKSKMEDRSGLRRSRRSRKWHRPARFNNRSSSKRSGRIPPSVKANAEEVLRIVKQITLPITKVIIEDVQIDIARLNNPELRGKEYQKSNRLDENLRLAALIRDNFKCQNPKCKKKNVRLEVHHIIPKEEGGKDSIYNLTTLCEECHKKAGEGKIVIDGGVSGFKDRIAQRTMQGKTYMYDNLSKIAPIEKVFGYQTSKYRKQLGLPKDHDIDALCIATMLDGEVVNWDRENYYEIDFRPEQTRRQYFSMPQKGKGRVRYQVNTELEGFHKGDIVLVKGKYRKQINSIHSSGRLAFKKVKGKLLSVRPSDCKLLEKQKTIMWRKCA